MKKLNKCKYHQLLEFLYRWQQQHIFPPDTNYRLNIKFRKSAVSQCGFPNSKTLFIVGLVSHPSVMSDIPYRIGNVRIIAEALTVLHCCYLHKLYHNWKGYGISYLYMWPRKCVMIFKCPLTICMRCKGIHCEFHTSGMFVFYEISDSYLLFLPRDFQVEG